MADARISELPAATTLASTDIIPFTSISASETRKITANNLGIALTTLGLSVGTSTPSTPYIGQLWVNTSTNPPKIFAYNGATFVEVSFHPADVGASAGSIATNPGATAPTNNALGQLWLDTSQTPDELKVFDGSGFVRVDPQGVTQTDADLRYLQITNANLNFLPLTGGTLTGDLTLNGNPTTNNMASNKAYVDSQISSIPAATDLTPAGTIIYSARTTAPPGYIKANGAAVSRTTFADLFAAIGTNFGNGNGSTTFNVPDLRGEFIRGVSDGRSVDSGRAFGSVQGSAFGQHNHAGSTASVSITASSGKHGHSGTTGNNNRGHTHGYDTPTFVSDDGTPAGSGGNIGSSFRSPATGGISQNHTHGWSTSNSGGHSHGASGSVSIANDGTTETRPRNIALLACIKT